MIPCGTATSPPVRNHGRCYLHRRGQGGTHQAWIVPHWTDLGEPSTSTTPVKWRARTDNISGPSALDACAGASGSPTPSSEGGAERPTGEADRIEVLRVVHVEDHPVEAGEGEGFSCEHGPADLQGFFEVVHHPHRVEL